MENATYTLGWYLVAFLDVLGQRERFRQLRLPKTPEEHAAVQEVLKDTAGFVTGLRKAFRDNFDKFRAGLNKDRFGAIPPPDFIGFSDSFIAFVALRNDDEHLTPTIRIFSALSAASVVMLLSLANKHALRGGIDVGLGTEISRGEIYGAALERPYLLECRHADYPRVLVGDELWNYLLLGSRENEKLTSPSARAVRKIIERQMQLTTLDADGKRILDYLGPVIADLSKQGDANALVERAYQFVLNQHEHWLLAGNTQLSGRYAILRGYFESRLHLWGLAAIKS